MPSLPDTDTGTSEDIFEGWTGRYTSPLALTSFLSSWSGARAKFSSFPLPFPPNYSPLSLLPAPHLHIPPLISHFPRTLSAPLIFTSLPSENSHAIRIWRTSITAFSLSHNPPLQNRGGHARQRGNFSNFRKSTSRVTKFTLSLYQVKSNSVQRLQTKSKKYLSKSEAMAVIFVFRSARKKNMKLAEDFQFLLPVTLHQIPYSGCRETIGHGSANQRPGRPSLYSDRSQSTILL